MSYPPLNYPRVLEALLLQEVGLGAPAVYYDRGLHVIVVERSGKKAEISMKVLAKLEGAALASYIMLACP